MLEVDNKYIGEVKSVLEKIYKTDFNFNEPSPADYFKDIFEGPELHEKIKQFKNQPKKDQDPANLLKELNIFPKLSELEKEKTNKQEILKYKLNTLFNELYNNLNLSILSGEYLNSHYINLINEITRLVDESILSFIDNSYLNEFSLTLKSVLKVYIKFIESFNSYISSNKIILFDYSSLEIDYGNNLNVQLTKFNLIISIIDLTFSTNWLNYLYSIYRDLRSKRFRDLTFNQDSSGLNYAHILMNKCGFLLLKIKLRLKHDKQHSEQKKFSNKYFIDIKDQILNDLEIDEKFFINELIYIRNHYGITKSGDLIHQFDNNEYNYFDENNIEDPQFFFKSHKRTKFFKDFLKNHNRLNDVIENIKVLKPIANIYDKYAFSVYTQYLLNNLFSLKIDSLSENDFLKAIDLINEIREIEEKNNLHNYFPYLKFLEHFAIKHLKKTNELIKKGNYINKETIEKNINFIEEVLRKVFENYDFCKERNFIHIRFRLSESYVEIDRPNDEKFQVLMFSRFFLPTNYDNIDLRIKSIDKEIEKEVNKLYLNLETISAVDSIKNQSNKSVEILAIFSAIVLYTSSSFHIFKIENINFLEAINYFAIVGIVLLLFTYLIFVITSNRNEIEYRKKLFLYPFLAMLIVLIITIINLCLI